MAHLALYRKWRPLTFEDVCGQEHITAALRAQAQGCGVSVTSYLAALLIQAIHAEMPALERSRPIVISLPVNLRNYYPSATTRNFFNSVRVPCTLSGQEDTAAVAHAFEQRLRDRLSEETIKARMDGYEQPERLLVMVTATTFSAWPKASSHSPTLGQAVPERPL